MKLKTTKKELNQNYNYIIRGGYCEFQTLLSTPKAREMFYACGVYGWNWDAYEIEASDGSRVCVCTGYRDLTGKRLEGLEKFEKKAAKKRIKQAQKQQKTDNITYIISIGITFLSILTSAILFITILLKG